MASNLRISISGALNALLVLACLFPFLPRLVPSSDTQPTFLLVFGASLIAALLAPSVGKRLYRITLPGTIVLAFVVMTITVCMLTANATQPESTIPARLISFLQLCAAAFWGYAGKFRWNRKLLAYAIAIQVVFTIVYFVTEGVLEDALIRSREDGAEFLFLSGRGARTLAPEPSFFALHVFNLFVLSRIIQDESEPGARARLLWCAAVIACLAASLSAYGVLLLIVVAAVTYPRLSALAAAGMAVSFGVLSSQLTSWEWVRAAKFIAAVVESRGSLVQLMVLEPSFGRRIASLVEYVSAFRDHPFIGNAFSLYQGGGFVSIVAALGILGLLFFVGVTVRTLHSEYSPLIKVLLLVWLAINFVSGPVGVPLLGVIIGTVFRTAAQGVATRPARALGPRAVVVSRS